MQEKKNTRLLISLVILTGITIAVFFLSNTSRTLAVDKKLFTVDDLKAIDQVILESTKGRVELTFNGSRWKVNNLYDADRDMVDVLFATLEQAEPKRPVASSFIDSVGGELEAGGVKVSMLAAGKLQQEFFAGGNELKTQAYFKKPGDIPYLMVIPGYRVYVSGILELEEGGWRDKYVFGFNWRNFKGMEVSFPSRPTDDFVVARGKDYFGIQGITPVDTTRLNNFIDAISLLTVDEYVTSPVVRDSLKPQHPAMLIRVQDIANREYVLKLFTAGNQKNQVMGLLNDSDAVLFNPLKIQPILKPREFFKQK